MNFANDGAKYGIDQYRFARNYDFKDKSFTITAGSDKYTLKFIGRDKVSFDSGKAKQDSDCECLKIEADTYFVRFGASFAVLEMSAGAATLVLPEGYVFGVIDGASGALHSFTDEMVGTGVRWMLGCYKFADHIYLGSNKCKAAWSPKEGDFKDYDAKYVKIKEGIFLVDITGNTPAGVCAPDGCDRVIMLEDFEHAMLVGCATSKAGAMMISGYGEFPDFDQKLFA